MPIIKMHLILKDFGNLSLNYLAIDLSSLMLRIFGKIYQQGQINSPYKILEIELVIIGQTVKVQLIINSQRMIGNMKILQLLKEHK